MTDHRSIKTYQAMIQVAAVSPVDYLRTEIDVVLRNGQDRRRQRIGLLESEDKGIGPAG